ncbi:uncharacterized protein LOC129169228 [Dunckerocampus dactyliophorus]|uniref:uncharacterized protein LOC129169228 n=1 Tax=Dunckerocampus dactyliophorus TaxID=161453 RepID=UPI002405EE24|nr:uncharacterized protein LOC129169228 [Dunckerocampus dactyliophorus]XP_054611409.1 uncharacterized protein LOC129169228 [Dunckerocampus dactyliophorus]
MSEAHNRVGWIQSDTPSDAISADSCHIVLETSPPDYVKNISQYLECSQNDAVPTELDSDSGDSLFLTQKPVPEPVRTVRRLKSSQHILCTELEDSGGHSSSSHSDDGQKTSKKKRKIDLPKYNFPFLKERKRKANSSHLRTQKNIKLHNYVTGGFFKCVQLWQGASHFQAALPTVDQVGEDISPLSENEGDGKSGDEDIKVMERKCFVVKSKAKCLLPWYTPLPCAKKGKCQHEKGAAFQQSLKSDIMSAGLSLTEEKTFSTRNNELNQRQTTKENSRISKRLLFPDESQDLCGAANFAGNEPVGREKSQVDTLSNEQLLRERQYPISEMNDELNNTEKEGGGTDLLSRQEAGGHVATSALPALCKAALHENNEMENLSHDASTLRSEDACVGESDITSIKQKKKKRQEDENTALRDLSLKEASVFAGARESGEHKSKKQKKSERGAEDDGEEFSSCTASEPPNDERRRRKKKKKQSHERSAALLEEAESCLDETTAAAKRKKKKKHHDSTQGGHDTSDKPCRDDATFTGSARKKKKKKKKEVSSCVSDEACRLNSPDQTQNVADKTHKMTQHKLAQLVTKKKEKKKKSSRHFPEDCGSR